jgi:hypothetical protein
MLRKLTIEDIEEKASSFSARLPLAFKSAQSSTACGQRQPTGSRPSVRRIYGEVEELGDQALTHFSHRWFE